jgi:CRISPR-associated protein Cmr3
MTTYWIDPKAPLLFRDGRAFGAAERAETLPFPLPSTVVGALRSAYGEAKRLDYATQKDQALKFSQQGPLLASRPLAGGQAQAFFPKPADALYFKESDDLHAARLAPMALLPGEGADLPAGLAPVFLRKEQKSKPTPGPAFWSLDTLADWLADDAADSVAMPTTGLDGLLPKDIRSHVAIDAGSFTSADGQLFQTSGLDFGPRKQAKARGWEDRSFGLLARVAVDGAESAAELPDGFRTVGGERRLAWIERCQPGQDPWPAMPDRLRVALRQAQGLRLALATPALFKEGWRPGWLDEQLEGTPPGCSGLKLKLRAVVLERWQAFSGWDLQVPKKHQKDGQHKAGAARAVRRLAPSGAVYWFEILPNPRLDAEERLKLLESLWLASLCDQDHDRRDGFGLALPGVWKPK